MNIITNAKKNFNQLVKGINKITEKETIKGKNSNDSFITEEKNKKISDLLNSNFVKVLDFNNEYSLYINEEKKQWAVDDGDIKLFNFKDILSFDIINSQNSMTNTISDKKVAPVKALVGKKLMGSAGAIIGGTSGKTATSSYTNDYCNELAIIIHINSIFCPTIKLTLLEQKTRLISQVYKDAFNTLHKYISLLEIMSKNK